MPPGTKSFKKVIYHIKWISMINCEPTVLPAFRLGTKGYNTYHVSRLLSREYVHVTPHVVTLISNPYHGLSSRVDRCRNSGFANSLIPDRKSVV